MTEKDTASKNIKPMSKATRVHINKDTITFYKLHPRARDVREGHVRKL